MANINTRKRLARISTELGQVLQQITLYSGIDSEHAAEVDRTCAEVVETAARIAAIARAAQGNRSAAPLVRNVRRALGFTSP